VVVKVAFESKNIIRGGKGQNHTKRMVKRHQKAQYLKRGSEEGFTFGLQTRHVIQQSGPERIV